jgi:hypothetical protein
MPPRRFRPRIDWWLWTTFLPIAFAWWRLTREPHWVAALVLTAATVLLAFLFLGSSYQLDGQRLAVYTGPFRWTVPLAEVQRVRRGGWRFLVTSFRLRRLRAALSARNLVLETQGFWREVVVSPSDEGGFLEALRALAPHVQVEV